MYDGWRTHDVDGHDDSDNESDDDIGPMIVVETVASKTTEQRHHHEPDWDKRTQHAHLATGARNVVNVNLRKANMKFSPTFPSFPSHLPTFPTLGALRAAFMALQPAGLFYLMLIFKLMAGISL